MVNLNGQFVSDTFGNDIVVSVLFSLLLLLLVLVVVLVFVVGGVVVIVVAIIQLLFQLFCCFCCSRFRSVFLEFFLPFRRMSFVMSGAYRG